LSCHFLCFGVERLRDRLCGGRVQGRLCDQAGTDEHAMRGLSPTRFAEGDATAGDLMDCLRCSYELVFGVALHLGCLCFGVEEGKLGGA
jgi:hypothetical protein